MKKRFSFIIVMALMLCLSISLNDPPKMVHRSTEQELAMVGNHMYCGIGVVGDNYLYGCDCST